MSDEHADRILEAGLEEVLGGRYPPDLTSTILQAWESRPHATARAACVAEDGPVSAAIAVGFRHARQHYLSSNLYNG